MWVGAMPVSHCRPFGCLPLLISPACYRFSQMLLGSFVLLIQFNDLRTQLAVDHLGITHVISEDIPSIRILGISSQSCGHQTYLQGLYDYCLDWQATRSY